jgi:hypothetical protein
VTPHGEALLAVVRPFLAEADSASELAYRLWRRSLEITLAEVVGLGAALPPGTSEELIASLAAQRLLLCAPLLRRTGKVSFLGIEPTRCVPPQPGTAAAAVGELIDASAAEATAGLGGSDFL